MSPVAVSGLLVFLHSCADLKNLLLGKWHWLLFFLACSMYPRMLVTVDAEMQPVSRRIIAEIWVAFSQNLSDHLGDRCPAPSASARPSTPSARCATRAAQTLHPNTQTLTPP